MNPVSEDNQEISQDYQDGLYHGHSRNKFFLSDHRLLLQPIVYTFENEFYSLSPFMVMKGEPILGLAPNFPAR